MWCVDNALIKGEIEECEYSTLPVMSELSTVQCDRALGLWIAGTRASSVDGELPWRCYRGEDFVPKKEPRPSDEIVYRGCCRPTGLTSPAYRSDRSRGYKYPFTCVRSRAAFCIVSVNSLFSQAAALVFLFLSSSL